MCPTIVILGCGVYLAMRTKSVPVALSKFIGCVVLAVATNTVLSGLVERDLYSNGEQGWVVGRESPQGAMSTLWTNIQAKRIKNLPPGFLDDWVHLGIDSAGEPEFVGAFTRQTSTAAWYTPFTGLYQVRFRPFHIWTPGGKANYAANRAVLVETDRAGAWIGNPVPIAAYDSRIVGHSVD